jgi:hypothetical protein
MLLLDKPFLETPFYGVQQIPGICKTTAIG